MSSAYDLLRGQFGFERFRPGQEEVIKHLLAGRSAAAVFPTGGGKSLCYQLPALIFSGLTVVVSPLIALMKDQIDRLKSRAVPAARLDSTLSAEETGEIMSAVRAGKLRLLYVAPERFNNERFRQALARVRVALFAVDEAHCISEWGHNFRPDYLKLAQFARDFRAERLLALTATATPQVLDDICEAFGIAPECAIRTGFYRSNLTLLTTPMTAAERDAALRQRLSRREAGPTIVYVTLQRTAEEVASRLSDAGLPAKAYHAGLAAEERTVIQEWFLAAERAIVVATIAFGMGIDKANIRAVHHYNVPKSLENYAQEIGRAGRDDQPAVCEMFVCPDDLNPLENFAYGNTPGPDAIFSFIEELFAKGEEFDVSIAELATTHDIRQLVVSTLLTYLELDGYLREGTSFFAEYQFQPLANSAEILARFDGERRTFLTNVLRLARKAKIWFHIDLDEAARVTGAPRDRVVRALDYLAGQQLLEVKVSGLRNHFRRLRLPPDLEPVAQTLHERIMRHEAREIARLGQVLQLAAYDGCQVRFLGQHFGETLRQPCGHCTWCLDGHKPRRLLPRPAVGVDPDVWRKALDLARQQPDPLANPRARARFLCGLSSPRATRSKLQRHALFGALAQVPFPEVLRQAQADGYNE
jgi:ATP-dependent DNA helicase RecQ